MSKVTKRLVLNLETLKHLDPVLLPEVQAGRLGTSAADACKVTADINCIRPFTIPCITTVPI